MVDEVAGQAITLLGLHWAFPGLTGGMAWGGVLAAFLLFRLLDIWKPGPVGALERLPGGIETEVGERGVRLSQGQRQRLAIAHAIACDNDLLVLDEPTSALDAESEAALQETFEHWHGRMTMLVIAHRLSTIRHADQILVLDDGRIAARGSHDQLMGSSELYRTLFETQLLVR